MLMFGIIYDTPSVIDLIYTESTSSCLEGNVTVVSDVNNNSLQLVEMCSTEGVWSPVCDKNWTPQDTTVVCRELVNDYKGFYILMINGMV